MAKHVKTKPSPLFRVIKVLYILLVILSIVIVGLFVAYNAFVRAPVVDSEVTFPISSPSPSPTSDNDPGTTSDPEPSASDDVIVYTRREGVYTCLLLGVADMGGSDSIMLGCFDTNNKTASLISIPRDTLVLRNGKNSKINAVYGNGGGEAVAQTVSNMLGVPVDFWMSVDLDAFEAIVETIGGVYFDVPVNMNYEDPLQNLYIHVNAGYQKLNGKQAVGVMRCRSCYANQDLGRVQTQRAFLSALVSQTITVSNATKVKELINILNKYVETNMPLENMIYFATAAIGMDLDNDLQSATLPGEWSSPYQETNDEEALELVNELLPVYTEPITADIMNIHHR